MAFLFSLLLALPLHAQEPRVQASFNPDSAQVGETVQFIIQITGGEDAERPPNLQVDGLDIHYSGPSTTWNLQFENGNIRRTALVAHVYDVTPRRTGDFVMPAVALQIGGRRFGTQPATLHVQGADVPTDNSDRNGRAEIILPKKTAYVGETLLTELRLSIDEQVPHRVDSMPMFEPEAFTKTKLSEGRPSTIVRNGRTYEVVSVRTALSPTKAGKLPLGPVEFQYIAQIPRPRAPSRQRSFFDQFFGNNMNGFGQAQRMTATSPVVELEVKPLPIAGRPANFSGAVGQFTLRAQGAPARIKLGDPLTMNVTVSGTGSFDRVTAPVLSDPAGWRAYPPTATYKGEDTTGVNGTKNFEIAIIPEEKKQEMPIYEFSYFDPAAEKYVTLKTDRVPLQVEGVAPLLTTPETRGPTQLAGATPPPAAPKPTDIVGLRYDLGQVRDAQPMYSQRTFLLVQMVPFSVLCGMIAVRFWPRHRQGREESALRRERTELLARLRRERTRAGFLSAAARILHVDAALRRERGAGVVGLATADEAPIVREIMDNHAQAHFSGGAVPAGEPLPEPERARILKDLLPLLNRP